MNNPLDIHKQAFREEAQELLTELEHSLLEWEEQPDDMELVGRIFRAMHTIKGSGAMFGFDDIARFTHEVETAPGSGQGRQTGGVPPTHRPDPGRP